MSSLLHSDQPSVTCIVNAASIVELARNTVNPTKCDWGAGTRTECNVMLGSWMLLKKHLHAIHCQKTRDGYVCKLSKCNCQLHLSQQALLDHVDSAHLSRIPLVCPIPNCTSMSFKGADSLVKHFEEIHKDLKGKAIKLPATDSRPVMKHTAVSVSGQKSSSSSSSSSSPSSSSSSSSSSSPPPPSLPRGGEIQPGTALVMNVHIKCKTGFMDEHEWLDSQAGLSQSQALTPSQGLLAAKRQRARTKQLEKVKTKDDDEEGIPSIVLDDLTSLGLANHPRIDVDARHHRSQWVGTRGKGSSRESGKNGLRLATMVEQGMTFGERSRQMVADLSRPQSMLEPEVLSRGGEDARPPRSILFDVAARRVDEQERLEGAASTSR